MYVLTALSVQLPLARFLAVKVVAAWFARHQFTVFGYPNAFGI